MIPAIYNHFNRGEIDASVLARDDIDKLRQSGAYMSNFLPVKYGPMYYREGSEYLGTLLGPSKLFKFVAATDDVAVLEFSANLLRFWINDELLTRSSVTSTIANPNFTSNLSNWTDASGTGSSTYYVTGGYAGLAGSGTTDAVLYQTITNTETGEEHALRVVVERAPVVLQLGTAGAESADIFEGTLEPGVHSLVFTPDSNITITLRNLNEYEARVDRVNLESDGVMTLPTDLSFTELSVLDYDQSADTLFFARGISSPQFKVERRGVKSWSIVDYRVDDGPFGYINSGKISLTPGALTGDTTLTASKALFTEEHVGALFKVGSIGQEVSASISAEGNGTGSIRITGHNSNQRTFSFTISGTFVGTIYLQRSVDDLTWEDVWSYTAPYTRTYYDALNNSILYYRLYVKSGGYTSGTINLSMEYSGGTSDGICRVTEFVSDVLVNVQVLQDMGSTDSSREWYEGEWSRKNGYPTTVKLDDGRLWWSGNTVIYGSVSDDYYSFDDSEEGDASAIRKTIGFGPVENVLWLETGNHLVMGLASEEVAIRSSTLGEALTQSNINLRPGYGIGSAQVAPEKLDGAIIIVQRCGKKIYEIVYDYSQDTYGAIDVTLLNPQIEGASIIRICTTKYPENMILALLDDGTIRANVRDRAEEVSAWCRLSTDGDYEDILSVLGEDEDVVYFITNRNGNRYLEKKAFRSNCRGGSVSHHFDCFKQYSSPGTTITGLDHHNGEVVGVWGDGADRGDYLVSEGSITVGSSWGDVVVGLRYTADWKSNKIGGFVKGSILGVRKRILNTGLIARYIVPGRVSIGADFDSLFSMPAIEGGVSIDQTQAMDDYHELPFEYDGVDEIDPRICIRATGPCTLLALVFTVKGNVSEGKNATKA